MSSHQQVRNTLIKRRKLILGIGCSALLAGAGIYTYTQTIPNSKRIIEDFPLQSIRIAWPKNEEDSLLTIAQEKDFFKKYGLNVILVPYIATSSQALESLKQRHCDAAVSSALDWLPNLLTGMPAKLLIGISGGNFRLLVSRKQRIDRLADFSGLKIATRPNAQKERLFFSILLRRKGLNPDQNVKWIEMEPEELLPALLSNQVQGIIGNDPFMWEILNNANKQVFELAGSQSGSWSTRINRILGISNDFLSQNPTIVKPLALSLYEASQWQNKHLQQTSVLLADHSKQMNASQILSMLKNQNQNIIPINNKLWEQVAQYIDEFKLLGRISNNVKSSREARQFCLNVPI
ncbi:ABC transporter substrate-binding protein [Commensalibacter oyaizuii]|uniref:ABC transporter substrate-binding protein n=1 Tax=Commensalibacter oyaizuii TaxID=3043873 RepID=A0ABT6Q0Z3_9PROT|nr:ABC transporter substrate-binding protein [Commensalibacter sp. TBRC 16381]MDI2090777.1 ABC transporter substrate-binding protein [Commensalibacter sp. TBRC 16381]